MALTANAVIVRVRSTPGGIDKYGDQTESTQTRVTMPDWAIAPAGSADLTDRARAGTSVELLLLAPFAADLDRDTDAVEVDGDLYQIEGDIGRWKSPFSSWEAGAEVKLRRAIG